MPSADVVVIGAGLSGLTAAVAAAQSGARVQLLAKGAAGTHWGTGGLDVAAVSGCRTVADSLGQLTRVDGHPYAALAGDMPAALAWLKGVCASSGLEYVGDLDTPLRPVPTSIGGTRPAAVLPAAQAPAAREWQPGETLFVCGVAGFKDFWPDAIAASLSRAAVWGEAARPERVVPVTVELPGMEARHNLNGLVLARHFDEATWRTTAIARIVAALEAAGAGSGAAGRGGAGSGGAGRVALPAVIGINDHAAAFAELRRRCPVEPFEMPLVPPSVPGMRLYYALRSALIAAGGRIQVGEWIANVERDGRRVTGVATEAAVRTVSVRTDALILATGGLSGGGIAADLDGTLREVVLGLPVDAPDRDDWFGHDAFDPNGHPLERAGIRTDSELRPLGPGGEPLLENVRVIGTLLAGQRYLRERCRDGVDFTSGWRAARLLSGASGSQGPMVEVRRP